MSEIDNAPEPRASLRRIDLNLALTFLAILHEGSVSEAARRLSLTQSAVSASLRRLRAMCGDDLFVRSRDGMVPTRRALAMAEPVAQAVEMLRDAMLGDASFDPARSQRNFVVGLGPGLEAAIGPPILRYLADIAPQIAIRFQECTSLQLGSMLESRVIDIGVGQPQNDLHQEILGAAEFVCILDPRACGVALPLDLDSYLALPHLLSSGARRDGPIDLALHALGRRRVIASTVTHFAALPSFLVGTRAVGTVPVYAARAMLALSPALSATPVPLDMPALQLRMLLRRDAVGDRGLAWLKALIAAEVRDALHLPSSCDASATI